MKSLRLIEIDALRGFAVLCMVFFHAAVDAQILGLLDFQAFAWPLIVPVRLVQFLFLGLVGVSVFLSSRSFWEQSRRAVKILAAALLVSGATYAVFPEEYVRFGVLHCVALSIPFVALFKKCPEWGVVFAVFVFAVGEWFLRVPVSFSWGLFVGLHPADFASLDYFPLLPWMAAPLMGLFVGSKLYAQRQPTRLQVLGKISLLPWMGRHSLAIYLLHQPILYFSLLLLSPWLKS